MKATTLKNAVTNLPQIIASTIQTEEETVIVTDEGSVVLVEQENWNSMVETLRLLRDKDSLSSLLQAIEARKKGNRPIGKTIDQIFTNV